MSDLLIFPEGFKSDKAREILASAAETYINRWEEWFHHFNQWCGSPIEEMILAAMYADHESHEFEVIFMGQGQPNNRHLIGETIHIYQQSKVGPYTVDFLIHDCSVPLDVSEPSYVVIECDGHDYHERTKEQARHDKKRDRYFQTLGYTVMRFTGSEIYADPMACVDEAFSVLMTNAERRNWRVA